MKTVFKTPVLLFCCLCLAIGALSACGKKGALEPPTEKGRNYPSEYPKR